MNGGLRMKIIYNNNDYLVTSTELNDGRFTLTGYTMPQGKKVLDKLYDKTIEPWQALSDIKREMKGRQYV